MLVHSDIHRSKQQKHYSILSEFWPKGPKGAFDSVDWEFDNVMSNSTSPLLWCFVSGGTLLQPTFFFFFEDAIACDDSISPTWNHLKSPSERSKLRVRRLQVLQLLEQLVGLFDELFGSTPDIFCFQIQWSYRWVIGHHQHPGRLKGTIANDTSKEMIFKSVPLCSLRLWLWVKKTFPNIHTLSSDTSTDQLVLWVRGHMTKRAQFAIAATASMWPPRFNKERPRSHTKQTEVNQPNSAQHPWLLSVWVALSSYLSFYRFTHYLPVYVCTSPMSLVVSTATVQK